MGNYTEEVTIEYKFMNIVTKNTLTPEDKISICQLWNNEYPQQLNYQDVTGFEEYLYNLSGPTHYLLIDENKEIKGWGFTFLRDGAIWFAILLDEKIHGKGFGTLLLNELKADEKELNGWVVDHENDTKQNGENYKSPLAFYAKNGFKVCEDIRMENEKISAVKIKWEHK